MARITVGIAASSTRFLVTAIASALEQTFTDFELLIADESPDGSVGDLVSRFQDPRIRLIPGSGGGPGARYARLWDEAATDALNLLSDQDTLLPTALADLFEVLNRDPDYVLAFGRRIILDAYGRVVRRPTCFLGQDWVWFEATGLAANLVQEIANHPTVLSSTLIRRSAFADASCLTHYGDLAIRTQVDVALLMNAAERGRSVAVCHPVAGVRELSETPPGAVADGAPFDWEIFLRGSVARGIVRPDLALLGLPNLRRLYEQTGRGRGEMAILHRGLPELEDLLAKGSREVLTERFYSDISVALYMMEDRAKQGLQTAPSAPEAQASGPPRFLGKIEHVSRDRAQGWAWEPGNPDQTVQVVALADDEVVGHAVADLERRDLADWNIGHGRYGFEMVFPLPLTSGVAPVFRLFAGAEDWLPGPTKLAPLDVAPVRHRDGAQDVLREHALFTEPGPLYEDFQWDALPEGPQIAGGAAPLVVAFYLSQYHATPENDDFWGTGFTEWRQLARGTPRFPGHYQPRIPRDLGFYNLLNLEVMAQQAAMAKAAGIGAFAYYYYWFDGQRVLHRPVEQFLTSDIEMPFFLIWANENWTRQWDGSEHELLLKQDYRREDEDALLGDLARHMADPRYVRLEGRPLFVIYNPEPIPDTRTTVARWRETWRTKFSLEPLIFMAQTFSRLDPRPYGFDGALEFPPHKLGQKTARRDMVDAFSADFTGQVMAYDDFVEVSLSEPESNFPLIKTAVPSWDNEARRPNRGVMLEGSSPQKYQDWLQALVERAIERPIYGTPLVAINAWNEWAEGAYLEPDIHYGSSYLNATARAVKGAALAARGRRRSPAPSRHRVAGNPVRVFLHIGLHKTGTTSIQGALTSLAGPLRDGGILYPETGRPSWANLGQHLLPWSITAPGRELPMVHDQQAQFGEGDRDALWTRLHEEISASGAGTIIVSSEEFDTLGRDEIEALSRRLDGYDVTPVLFLRRASKLLESNYRTSVIYGRYGGDLEQFRRDHRTRLDIGDLVKDWRTIAMGGKAIILDYEQDEIQRDVVNAFLTTLGLGELASGARLAPRLNKSLPAFMCETVRFMRQSEIQEGLISSWIEETGRLPMPTDAARSYTCMSPDLEAVLDADYRREIEALSGDPEVAAMVQGDIQSQFAPSTAVLIDDPALAMLVQGRELRKGMVAREC